MAVFPFSQTSMALSQAIDPINYAAAEMGRQRVGLRDQALHSTDAEEIWRISRAVELAIEELEATKTMILNRLCQIEGHE